MNESGASAARRRPSIPCAADAGGDGCHDGGRDGDTGGAAPALSEELVAEHLLSSEELAILRLLAEGLPLDSVAQHMSMSTRTVRRRLRGVCDRLGVAHPIQAIVWTARRGLV